MGGPREQPRAEQAQQRLLGLANQPTEAINRPRFKADQGFPLCVSPEQRARKFVSYLRSSQQWCTCSLRDKTIPTSTHCWCSGAIVRRWCALVSPEFAVQS